MRTHRSLLYAVGVIVAVYAVGCADDDKGPAIAEPVEDAAPPPPDPEIDAMIADAYVEPDAAPIEPDMGPVELPDAAPAPIEVVAVDTRLGAEITEAGVANRVTCVALAADDGVVADVTTRLEARPAEGWVKSEDDPFELTGETAGIYQITCTAPMLGLRDVTPARWEVVPAEAVEVRATVEPGQIVAGETAEVSCEAVDAFGNPVDSAAAEVTTSPEGAGVQIAGRTLDVTAAGRYQVACALGGAAASTARLDVTPGLPANLVAALSPDEEVYAVGQIIGFPATVTDTYGNPVAAAPLVWTADPVLPAFGEGRFLAAVEGIYTLEVHVDGPTLDDIPLSATADALVDAGGPAIRCDQPTDGAMLRRNGPVTLSGEVRDIAGLAALEIDGQPVEFDLNGRFSVQQDPSWGLNVHELVARDQFGNENSTLCTYFAADDYLGEDAALFDGIALHLTQSAIDDGRPNRPIRSLGDLLRGVLDSNELVQTIHNALSAQNPIVPNECRARFPNPFGSDPCIARLGAEYRSLEIRGARDLGVQLLAGGIRFQARINDILVRFRTTGTITVNGSIRADYVALDITFNVDLDNGRPRVRLRSVNNVQVGGLDLDLDGAIGNLFDGAVDLIFGAFDDLVRDELVNAVRDFLESELDALLSGILDGLDLASLGLAFDIPTLDGSPPIALALGVAFDQVNVNANRLRIGISTRAEGPVRQPAPADVPLLAVPSRVDASPDGSIGGAVSLGLINQVLHRLWRAGFFHFDDAGALLGELPDGAELGLEVRIPPAVEGIDGNRVRLHLGPAVASLVYPGLFDDPLRIRLAATVTAAVDLVGGDELVFGGVEVETLRIVIEGVPITAVAREAIEGDLRRIVQSLADQALNDLLPNVPIPDFALPDDLVQYGVPAGTRLGLRGAILEGIRTHFLLDGSFGE